MTKLAALEEALGYRFTDRSLLERALTHRSGANTTADSYERLEFLGDALLGFFVSDRCQSFCKFTAN